jgi:hypothetical protein
LNSWQARRPAIDNAMMTLLLLGALAVAGLAWLRDHPQHNPWAPLRLDDPPGWATARKLARLRAEPAECRAVLERSGIAFTELSPAGEGQCRRTDRLRLPPMEARGLTFRPSAPEASCAVHAAVVLWLDQVVQPAARQHLGSEVVAIEHLGTYGCRRIGGGEGGRWSEPATGNAIDIAGFTLADGERVVLRRDWSGPNDAAAFLREVRDGACGVFGTVLSPDYNAAHADHFHFDQDSSRTSWSYCR